MVQTDEIRALADAALRAVGLAVWDVEIGGDAVRVFVDCEGGVDLEALGAATTAVSELLDDHDDLAPPGAYHLEVSSPGLERTLRTPDHFARYVGSTVTIKTAVAIAGGRRHRGILVEADAEGVTLRPDTPASAEPLRVTYDRIERARTVLDWGPTPKAPKPSRSKAKAEPGAAPARPDPPAVPDSPVASDVPAAADTDSRLDASGVAPGARPTKDPLR